MPKLLYRFPSVATARSERLQRHWFIHDHIIAPRNATARAVRRRHVDDRLLSDTEERLRLGRSAESRVAQYCDPVIRCREIEQVYHQVIQKATARNQER